MIFSDKFREELLSKLSLENISNTSSDLEKVLQFCIGVLDKLTPQKNKYNRGNNMPFMNKLLARAHMKRSRLQPKSGLKSTELIISSNTITM